MSSGSPPRFGIIGGSGVQLEGRNPWRVETPYGPCQLAALDEAKRVLFASRHSCTSFDEAGKPVYAPPHVVNYRAIIWALVACEGCKGGIIALGSTGSLDTEGIPVGSVVMADDYYMVRPEPVTFFPNAHIGSFETPGDGIGRMHYTPANPLDTEWLGLRRSVQQMLRPVFEGAKDRIKLARGQTSEIWPCVHSLCPGKELSDSLVYVNSIGPRFETRAEIRTYRSAGHVVGMTCGNEWMLCEELCVPYCLVCFCDNACNGLSTHPGGALEEYLEHKQTISDITTKVIEQIVAGLSTRAA